MIVIISPAKTIDLKASINTKQYSQALFLKEAGLLVDNLRAYDPKALAKLMDVNNDIAELNYGRYMQWQVPFTIENAKQALAVFRGQVFIGLDAKTLSEDDLVFAQGHLRILSGLYGILNPLDLIQAYRLEMGIKLKNKKGKTLYDFWGDKIAVRLNDEISKQKNKVLINLASNEYYKAIKPKLIKGDIITPVFKEAKGGGFKVVTIYAKTARGLMSRFIIENRIEEPELIKAFDTEGYLYNKSLSTEKEWVFTR